MPGYDTPTPASKGSTRSAPRHWALVVVIAILAVVFILLIRSLALPLLLAAIVTVLAHPLQDRLVRRMGGLAWLVAAGLTVAFALVVVCPPIAAVYMAYDDIHDLLREAASNDTDIKSLPDNSGRLQPGIAWVGKATGVGEERLRDWIRAVGTELEQVLYHRSLKVVGDLPGFAIGMAVFILSLFFFLKDGPQMVSAWEDITPLDNSHERLIHQEFAQVCRGLVWSSLGAAVAQGVAFGLGLFVLDSVAGTGVGHLVILLSLVTVVCSPIPFLGAASVWASTAAVLFLRGHSFAAVALVVYGAAVVSQVDTVVRVWVLNGIVRMHPLLVFVSILGGIQMLGILGLVVGPMVAAVLLALLMVLRKESEPSQIDPSLAAIPPDPTEQSQVQQTDLVQLLAARSDLKSAPASQGSTHTQ